MEKTNDTSKDTDIIVINFRIPASELRNIDKVAKDELLDRSKLIRRVMRDFCNNSFKKEIAN